MDNIWIDKTEMEIKNLDKASKLSIAAAVWNGAVYEPEFKKSNLIDNRSRVICI